MVTGTFDAVPHLGIYHFYFFLFWPRRAARRILFPWPGIEHVPLAVEVRILHHWTAREDPGYLS